MPRTLASHNFGWDDISSRYYDITTGRYVITATVNKALEEAIIVSQNNIAFESERMVSGVVSLPQWQLVMEREIKLIHTASAALARGGWAQMTQADWGWVGQRVRRQYEYLRNFSRELADGTQPLNGRAVFRAKMYAQASRNTYEEMRRRYMKLHKGAVSEQRILDPQADHCVSRDRQGCVELAALGMQPVGKLPSIGEAQCLTMCRCHFRFFDENGKQIGG